MTLEEMAANTRSRVQFALGDYLDHQFPDGQRINSDTILIEVVDRVRAEERKGGYASPYRYTNTIRRKVRPNRAIRTSQAIFDLTQPLKERLKEQFLSGELIPDERTLNIWFLEHLLYLALDHHWHWVGVAVFKILFVYEHEEFTTLYDLFNYNAEFPDDSNMRRLKLDMLKKLEQWFRGMVQVEEVRGRKVEKQFKRPPYPSQNIDLAEEALGVISPAKLCTIHNNSEVHFNSESERYRAWLGKLEKLNEERLAKSYDESEREIMLLLTCPNCLFDTFKALSHHHSNAKQFHNWHERLGFPAYTVPTRGGRGTSPADGGGEDGSGGEDMTPLDQRPLDSSGAGEKIDINREMRRRDDRRRNLSPEFVLIIIDGGSPLKFWLDAPKSRPLTLREGSRVIEVRGVDEEGSLLLDLHRLSWDSELDDKREYVFVTELNNDRRLEFKLKYERDEETDELTSATGDIVYSNPHARSLFTQKKAAGTLASVLAVATSFLVLSGVTWMGVAYFQKPSGPGEPPSQVIASEPAIKSEMHVEVEPSTTPAPNSPTPTPTPAGKTQQNEGRKEGQHGRDGRGEVQPESQQTPRAVPDARPGATEEASTNKGRIEGGSSTRPGPAPIPDNRASAQRRTRVIERHGTASPKAVERAGGDLVEVTFNTTISSGSARDGQEFFTTVTGPTLRVPKGTVIKGEVSQVTKARAGGGIGALRIRFTEMRLPNSPFWQKINGNLVMQPSSSGDMQSTASPRSRARREMIIVGDKKESFRLVPKDELPAITGAMRREAMGIARSRIKQERVEALVPVDEKLYISLEGNDSMSAGTRIE